MAIAAETAVRTWVNDNATLVGNGKPLSRGAYLHEQRSPADGAYAVITRTPEIPDSMVAEDGRVAISRMQAYVYAGTEVAAEAAAAAMRTAFEGLSGAPEKCGDTGVTVLATDNLLGPYLVPHYGESGEQYCFSVHADFILVQQQ